MRCVSQELAALACTLKLDKVLCAGPEASRWGWLRRYCLAMRTAEALINR